MKLKNKLFIIKRENERQTRQAGSIAIPFCDIARVQKSIFYEGIKMFNALLTDLLRKNRKL